jgi:hypothetical protein
MPARRSCWPPGWRRSATTSCSSPGWTTGAPRRGHCLVATARKAARSSHRHRPPGPAAAVPSSPLFDAPPARDYSQVRFDLRRGAAPDNPWLAWALHLAYVTAEARGWQPVTRRAMQRVLVTLLAGHCDGETVSTSAVHAVACPNNASTHSALEIMTAMGILADDRPDLFTGWLDAKLDGLAAGLASEARRWALALHDGGPRTRPRSPDTARAYLRAARPGWPGPQAMTICVRSPATTSSATSPACTATSGTRRSPRCARCSPGRRTPP